MVVSISWAFCGAVTISSAVSMPRIGRGGPPSKPAKFLSFSVGFGDSCSPASIFSSRYIFVGSFKGSTSVSITRSRSIATSMANGWSCSSLILTSAGLQVGDVRYGSFGRRTGSGRCVFRGTSKSSPTVSLGSIHRTLSGTIIGASRFTGYGGGLLRSSQLEPKRWT